MAEEVREQESRKSGWGWPLKLAAWVVGVVVALVVILLLVLHFALTPVVKQVTDYVGKNVLKDKIDVEDVSLNLFTGRLTIRNFKVGNPGNMQDFNPANNTEKFETPTIMEVGEIYVNLNMRSIFSDKIQIREITIREPHITYEMGGFSDSNVQSILNHIKESKGPAEEKPAEEAKPAEEPKKPGKKVIIDLVRVTDGKIRLASKVTGNNALPIPLPDIEIKDIGKEKPEGTSMVDATCEILTTICTSVGDAVVAAAKQIKEWGEAGIKAVGEAAGAAVDATKDAAKGAADAVKGLFGGDKDKDKKK